MLLLPSVRWAVPGVNLAASRAGARLQELRVLPAELGLPLLRRHWLLGYFLYVPSAFQRGPGLGEGHSPENPPRFALRGCTCPTWEIFQKRKTFWLCQRAFKALNMCSRRRATGVEFSHRQGSFPLLISIFRTDQQGGGTRCVSEGTALLPESICAPSSRGPLATPGRFWGRVEETCPRKEELLEPRSHGHEGPQQVPCSTAFSLSPSPCLFGPLSS